jgi:hypothetical protein
MLRRSRTPTISDEISIELHHVEGLNHSDNMLIAYLPKQKILVSADMGGPPPAGSPAPANVSNNSIVLYNNIKRLKLDVTTHVPIHGAPGPQAEFDRIVGPAAARAPQPGGGGNRTPRQGLGSRAKRGFTRRRSREKQNEARWSASPTTSLLFRALGQKSSVSAVLVQWTPRLIHRSCPISSRTPSLLLTPRTLGRGVRSQSRGWR